MAQQRPLARHPGSIYPGSPRLGDLFEQFLEEMHDYDDSLAGFAKSEIPKVDIRESKKAVVVEAEIPGMTGEGKIYRFALPGPELDKNTWQTCLAKLDELDPPDLMVLSGSLPPGVPEDLYGRIARRFRDQRTRIILDTSGEPFRQALQHRLFLIKPNQRELEDFVGASLDGEAEQERACRDLINRHDLQAIALTLGSAGAMLVTAESQFRVRGLKVEPRSPIGAGDSFVGAMALALESGKPLRQAFLYGMAGGTAALITPGSELCRKADTETYYQKLIKQHGKDA